MPSERGPPARVGGSSMAVVPTLPLRADVLLSNTLFEELDEEGVSEDFLRQYLRTDRLDEVDFLEIQVDTVSGSQRVECIGDFLPNLQRFRLNQSHVCSIRDLGTGLQNLRVLWLCRSLLQDLGGIAALPALEELYVAFNDIRDLSPLSTHESLQLVDLEGNLVDELCEVESLCGMTQLRELNLSLNPLWRNGHAIRDAILKALPQLEVLDDESTTCNFPSTGAFDGELCAVDVQDIFSGGEDDDGGLGSPSAAMKDVVAESSPRLNLSVEVEESRGLRELRKRAAGLERDNADGQPVESSDGVRQRQPAVAGPPQSAAIAEFHECMSRLQGGSPAPVASDAGKDSLAEEQSPVQGVSEEPSEQDLVVEGLKRAQRPPPSLWTFSASARPAISRPAMGFFPDRRHLRSAWGSSAGSSTSTLYRPATSSSDLNSSRSTVLSGSIGASEVEASSDLTAGGEDGSALVGNPLAAIRHRRRIRKEQGEDDFNIRSLLRRYEGVAAEINRSGGGVADSSKEPSEIAQLPTRGGTPCGANPTEFLRLGTPDVRIGPPRTLASGNRGPTSDSLEWRPPSRAKVEAGVPPQLRRSSSCEVYVNLGTSFFTTEAGAEVLDLEAE